jgi:site-specific recombinase XerD
MGKIKLKTGGTIAEHFEAFLLAKQADGLSGKTLTTYRQHFGAVSKHLASGMELDALQKKDLDNMIVQMRGSGLSSNSISSYTRTLKSFFLLV